jgi:hypothetical protein
VDDFIFDKAQMRGTARTVSVSKKAPLRFLARLLQYLLHHLDDGGPKLGRAPAVRCERLIEQHS